MHRFLRAAGFSMYQKKKDIRALLRCLAREAGTSSCLQLDRETELYEIKTEVAPGIGVAMYGELNEQDEMEIEYYYPYILNEEVTSRAECSIQRHTEKETYAGLLDEYKVGLSLLSLESDRIQGVLPERARALTGDFGQPGRICQSGQGASSDQKDGAAD